VTVATIYPKGGVLYARIKVDGRWRGFALGVPVGKEREAQETARHLEARFGIADELGAEPGAPLTLRQWSAKWLADKRRGKADAESHLDTHILPALGAVPLDDLRTPAIRKWARRLSDVEARRQSDEAKVRTLAPRTVRNVVGTLHACLRAAVAEGLIAANPVVLLPDDLPAKADADPEWRASAVFTRGELETLISDERIPADRRTLYALLGLAGLRFGEAAALRCRHHDGTLQPLGRLLVATSFRTPGRLVKGTKTGAVRAVPVHPTLAAVLATWRPAKADPDALLIPSREGVERSVSHGLKRFHQDCAKVGIRERRLHDLRRTFISLCRDDGASRDVLRWVTHAPPKEAFDTYTSFAWPTVCAEVARLRVGLKTGEVVSLAERRKG
jgi:integrase